VRRVRPGSEPGSNARARVSENASRSLVVAASYRVKDVDRVWTLIQEGRSPLVGLGARYVVLYTSIKEPGRVLVTIGIRRRTSVQELLRSPAVFEWFDLIGVDDLPAIFAGKVLEKINLVAAETDTIAPGVVIGAVSAVADVAELMTKVHDGLHRFRDAGVRKVWIYRAFDDEREVMTLMELDSVVSAQRWIDDPDDAAEWMPGAGFGVYPGLFVGKLAYVMRAGVGQ
jgi:hypothetical protein